MNTTLIKLFNAALSEKSTTSFAAVNAEAIQRGYIVEPAACTDSVLAFLQEQDINPNATFYKTWEDVLSKTRFELLIDQIFHYMTTYGTDFVMGNGYVPNDGEIDVQTTFNTYKVIKAITAEDLYKRCADMLASGIALKQETMHAVADYMIEMHIAKVVSIDVDAIKNREALIYICDKLDIFPNDKFGLLRYIIYKTTGSEMIIKNKELIESIKNSTTQFDFSKLTSKQMESLASIFLRYKELFLAFKHAAVYSRVRTVARHSRSSVKYVASSNAPYINKLRKMAIKLHEPMKQGFWQNVFSTNHTIDELNAHVDELTSYKKVALMQSCMERATALDNQIYVVRNQKMYLREGYKSSANVSYITQIYAVLYASLLNTLRKNSVNTVHTLNEDGEEVEVKTAKKVRLADGVSVALPSSEKSFIGNYPFGTTYMISDYNYFGIYWRNEWGTRDYDLSFMSVNGNRIGWNSDYYNNEQNIIFSGDMTYANPEAAEVILMKNAGTCGIVKVNQYSGEAVSKFHFFFGQSAEGLHTNNYNRAGGNVGYMVDPTTIKLKVEVSHKEMREQQVAVVADDRIVLMSMGTGNNIVSRNNKYTQMVVDAIMHKAKCFVSAEDMLKDAGFEIVDSSYTGDVDIDFTNLDKDSLISVMQ